MHETRQRRRPDEDRALRGSGREEPEDICGGGVVRPADEVGRGLKRRAEGSRALNISALSACSAVTSQQGFALITAMGVLSALLIMGLSLSVAARSDLWQTRRFQDAAAAEFLAKGGVEWTIHYLNGLDAQGRLWQAPWQDQPAVFRQHVLKPGTIDISYTDATGATHYGLQDEEARVNVQTAPVDVLTALPGGTQAIAAAIVAQRQRKRLTMPEELVSLGIIPAALYYGRAGGQGMGDYLTVWGSGKINLNTAPEVVLAALPGMSSAIVEAIMQYRAGEDQQPGSADDRYFREITDLRSLQGIDPAALARLEPWLTVVPTAFRVIATGRVVNGQGAASVYRQLAIIDRTSRPVRIQQWWRLS